MRDRVVVITGASSGIGRETAYELARRGARLVLVARHSSIEQVAAACRDSGTDALGYPADVTEDGACDEIARAAVSRFGHLDVWVNNAAVLTAGRFLDTPSEAFRRVIETNLFGYVNGARASLPYFIEQRYGVLVNNASVLGVVAAPNMSAYIASKFAIRGFSEVLRQEMRDHEGVSVSTVLPATILTPIWSHAANFTGRQLLPVPPVYRARDVARTIVSCIERPRAEALVGGSAWVMRAGRFLPKPLYDALTSTFARVGLGAATAAPTAGNLFEPMGAARIAEAVERAMAEPTNERRGVSA